MTSFWRRNGSSVPLGVDLATFDQFAPWFVAEAISQLQLAQLGFQAESGVEMYFVERARADGKHVSGLETLDDQITLFGSMPLTAQADYLLRLHRLEPDLTLAEICARLERARGEKVSPSMIWRFFDRHDITYKKSRRTRANRTGPTCSNVDGDGSTANSTSTR